MGQIVNIKNFNLYTGRYSRKSNNKTPEHQIGWYVYDSFLEKAPVQIIRRRNEDDDWPLSWKRGRNLDLAIDSTLKTLKAWSAFRPVKLDDIYEDIRGDIRNCMFKFQRKALELEIATCKDICDLEKKEYDEIISNMANNVAYLSSYKSETNPMLGSKILHFLYPEFFPVWDTVWIKNSALKYEDTSQDGLEDWLSEEVIKKLRKYEYSKSSIEYAKYLALMMKDIDSIKKGEIRNIEKALCRHAELDGKMVSWCFIDLVPIIFEFCLLGKHTS